MENLYCAKYASEPSTFSRAKYAVNLSYPLPLSQSRQQVVSIQVPYQSRVGRTKQAVDLLAPTRKCSSSSARIVWMRLSRKLIFQALQKQGRAQILLLS